MSPDSIGGSVVVVVVVVEAQLAYNVKVSPEPGIVTASPES